MRKIKFRGKHLCGQWYFGNLIVREVDSPIPETKQAYRCVCIGDIEDGSEEEVEENTIGQFTGLYDCKEREIYEGDLLGSQVSNHYLEVRFIDGMFRLCGLDDATGFGSIPACYLMNKNNLVIEVIGNIYDNKELLTQN